MKPQDITGHGPHVQGYAWHAFPDPATPGVFEGDIPFDIGDAHGPPPSNAHPPRDVVRFWPVDKHRTRGLANEIVGHSFLVVTGHLEPPDVAAGWFVEEARLAPNFELDLGNDREVILLRIIQTTETEWGLVQHCEFEVDEE